MVCDSALAKDVEPRFQLYSQQGNHLEDKDDLLQQPRLAGGQQVPYLGLLLFLQFPCFSLFSLVFPCFPLFLLILHGFYPLGACHEGDFGVHHPPAASHRDNHGKCEIFFSLSKKNNSDVF